MSVKTFLEEHTYSASTGDVILKLEGGCRLKPGDIDEPMLIDTLDRLKGFFNDLIDKHLKELNK